MKHLEQAVALTGLCCLGLIAAIPPDALLWLRVLLAVGAMGAAMLSLRRGGGPGGAVAFVAASLGLGLADGLLWQVVMPLALVGYSLVARRIPALLSSGWRDLGQVPWGLTVMCGAVTPVALVSWVLVMQPNLNDLLQPISQFSPPLLVVIGALFVVLNAAGEELIWRGVFQDRLSTLFGTQAAILIQGVSFGIQHTHGFPRGIVGVCLAGVWGLLQGWLRAGSGGVLAPILAHTVADATIAVIVFIMAQHAP